MSLRRAVARGVSEVVACGRLGCQPPAGLRVLLYHAIGTPALEDAQGLFSISPDQFTRQMEFLAGQYSGRITGLPSDVRIDSTVQVAISFDDGYEDNLTVAAPILAAQGLPYTVFVTSDFVKHSRPGFLTPSGLRELAALPNVHIGAHGATHIALSACAAAALREELRASKQYLEDTLGRPVDTMAYPYGSADRRVREAVREAGYRLAMSSYALVNEASRDRLMLGRTEVLRGEPLRVFQQRLHGDWDWYRWRMKDPATL